MTDQLPTYDDLRREMRALKRLLPNGDFSGLWRRLNIGMVEFLIHDTVPRAFLSANDLPPALRSDASEYFRRIHYQLARVMAVATVVDGHPNIAKRDVIPPMPEVAPQYPLGIRWHSHSLLFHVDIAGLRFHYYREAFVRSAQRAFRNRDERWVRFVKGYPSECEVDFDAGTINGGRVSSGIMRVAVQGVAPVLAYVIPASRYDCPQMGCSDRMASGYHMAYGAKPTGRLTDDDGGIFECRLIRLKGRGHRRTPVVCDGVAVRYVVNGEESWGFARTLDAAKKLARSHLAQDLQQTAQAGGGVSLVGGFL